MPREPSFSLDDHFSDFIERQVAQGRYDNAGEVVRAGLRLLEEREARLAALRASLIEGETSGFSKPFDFDACIDRQRDQDRK